LPPVEPARDGPMSSDRVCVIGLWHLGLVTAACLADLGRKVVGLEQDAGLIEQLRNNRLPIFEPGLEELVATSLAQGKLWFTSDPRETLAGVRYAVIAYDTKVDDQDESDLSQVMAAAALLARHLENGSTVVVSSQVPVGTCERIEAVIRGDRPSLDFGIAYVPENLKLGQAIERFKQPDVIVIGSDDPATAEATGELLAGIECPRVVVGIRTAEMIKHALNAFLATCISFGSEMANLCDEVGADALELARTLHFDRRVGPLAPLRPGLGFAGGTLARDLKTLLKLGEGNGTETPLVEAVLRVNEHQNHVVTRKLRKVFGSLEGLTVGILGLTYKPDTSTLRRSVALGIIDELTAGGAAVRAYDPRANLEELPATPDFEFCADPGAVALRSDALVIVTEWPEFRSLDFCAIRDAMRNPLLIDAQNVLDAEEMTQMGFRYLGVGRGSIRPRSDGV
jgi:UDPglucose 6-dehydrogenase